MCFVKPPQIGGNLKCFAAIRKCANERLLCKFKSAYENILKVWNINKVQIWMFFLFNQTCYQFARNSVFVSTRLFCWIALKIWFFFVLQSQMSPVLHSDCAVFRLSSKAPFDFVCNSDTGLPAACKTAAEKLQRWKMFLRKNSNIFFFYLFLTFMWIWFKTL